MSDPEEAPKPLLLDANCLAASIAVLERRDVNQVVADIAMAAKDSELAFTASGGCADAVWRRYLTERGWHRRIEMLTLACQQLDRAESCRAEIDRDGEIIRSKTGVREHPLLKIELAGRAFVVRTLHRLGLDVEAVKPIGRPPGTFGRG